MNKEIEARIKDLEKLFGVGEMIEYEIDDSTDKVTAQKIIDSLIVSNAQEIVNVYNRVNKN